MELEPISLPKPVLLVAAESIAVASQANVTVEDVVFHRALKHYIEGLRQYFALRLGSLAAAEQALSALRVRLGGLDQRRADERPGPARAPVPFGARDRA